MIVFTCLTTFKSDSMTKSPSSFCLMKVSDLKRFTTDEIQFDESTDPRPKATDKTSQKQSTCSHLFSDSTTINQPYVVRVVGLGQDGVGTQCEDRRRRVPCLSFRSGNVRKITVLLK